MATKGKPSMTWLRLLPMEIDSVTELITPAGPIKRSEKPLGEMSEDLKRMWTLSLSLKKAAAQCKVERQFATSPDETWRLFAREHELESKAKALSYIFWISFYDEFDAWGKSGAFREGWQAVEAPQEDRPEDLFRRFFGFGDSDG